MRGEGRAHAAISILNGTATGIGCSLAVAGGVEATWDWGKLPSFESDPACDAEVAQAVLSSLPRHLGEAAIRTRSTFPARRGLKTSSGSAAALLRAAYASLGSRLSNPELITAAVAVCRTAGVTLTGALDDQAAVVEGGCHLADSRNGTRLRSFTTPRWHVAIWVPEASIPKDSVAMVSTAAVVAGARRLVDDLGLANLPDALTANGRLFTALYRAAGLPVTQRPADVALNHGALGAGLSGTGPAVAALFDERVELPAIPGGIWHWTRAVPEAS